MKVKKLKQVLPNGSLSDYIDIGANAINIDMSNGYNVEEAINQKIYYFNTIADMKASNKLKSGNVVQTLGYYSTNDCGGANYLIRNKTNEDVEDNGSIHFIESNLVAEMIVQNNTVNVKQFGAKGDNITDNTTSIQKAVNYASNKSIKVLIPTGVFRVETIHLKSNTHICGESKINSILKRISTFNTDNYKLNYRYGYILGYYSPSDEIENVSIENFTIDGIKSELNYTNEDLQAKANTQNILIKLCDNLTIKDMIIKNSSKSGINISGCDNVIFKNNQLIENGLNLPSIDANGITIYGKYYNDTTSSSVLHLSKNIKVLNNYCYKNEDEGITYCYCKNIIIDGNSCVENGDRGIEGDSTSYSSNAELLNVQITNNFICDNEKAGITEYSTPQNMNYICSNNIIKNVNGYAIAIGIDATDIAKVVIENNIIDNCNSQPFNIVATEVIINNNIIKNVSDSFTISGINIVNFCQNIINNEQSCSKECFIKSNGTININNNNISDYLRRFTIQKSNSNVSKVAIVNCNSNTITNSITLIYAGTNINSLNIQNNSCIDTRETVTFQGVLGVNSDNLVDNASILGNNDAQAIYGLNVSRIGNLTRGFNSSNGFYKQKLSSKPATSSNYNKKGDIIYNSSISINAPVGWIFDGSEWHSFGTITD